MGKGIAGNQRGTALVTFTLLLTALLGFAALGIEVGTWYVMRAELSKAVDAAALAGAANIASPNLNLVTLAQDFGDANFAPGYLGTAGTGSAATTAGSAQSRAVPPTTTDHLRHAPRFCPHTGGNLTGSAASPLLPRVQRTSGRGPAHRGGPPVRCP